MDGHSSELDMEDLEEEEEESQRKNEICSSVPKTPDQEAFLKENFANLSEFSTSGILFVCALVVEELFFLNDTLIDCHALSFLTMQEIQFLLFIQQSLTVSASHHSSSLVPLAGKTFMQEQTLLSSMLFFFFFKYIFQKNIFSHFSLGRHLFPLQAKLLRVKLPVNW